MNQKQGDFYNFPDPMLLQHMGRQGVFNPTRHPVAVFTKGVV
jgi:hypothetical protein